jgi:hypothetical protein
MRTVTRKEIADAAGVSLRTIQRKEKKWGLDKCRSNGCERPITYIPEKASRVLISKDVISEPL